MAEVDKRTESDGKGLFIIRNGQKIATYEAGKWVPLLPGVVVRDTPDGIKIEMPRAAPSKSEPSKAWLKIKNPKAPAATRVLEGTF